MSERKIKPKQCVVCGKTYQPNSWNSLMVPICSPECKAVRRAGYRKIVVLPCVECGQPVECKGKNGLAQARRGRAYCSEVCKMAYTGRLSSERMAETNRRYASERMKKSNPMGDPIVKEKIRTKLRLRGWGSGKRGGNGTTTMHQRLLACALGWPMEVAIPTQQANGSGYPYSYKVDIANETLKIAIEVDGNTHKLKSKQEEDRKKEALLTSLGWTVLRFWNAEVETNLDGCVQTVTSTISKLKISTPTLPTVS